MRIYNKCNRNKKIANIVSLLIFILVFSITIGLIFREMDTPIFNDSAEALNSSGISSAVKAGGGTELWDSSNNRFNQNVLKDIIDKIFKQEDPVSFIKDNGKDDYETYGKKAPSLENGIEYFVVPATVINKNVGNANYGMVIKLDNKWWMATSLTLTKSTNTTNPGNVVLTLMLAEDAKKSVTWATAATKDSLSYSSSGIRKHLITDNQWSLFNDGTTGSFANRFLVKPKDIQYQHINTVVGRISGSGNYNIPNCALGNFTSGWYSSDYEYLAETSYGGVKYNAWGEDYIWSPSYQEMGLNNHASDKTCIWQLSSAQRYHTSSTNVLVRDLYVSQRSIVSKTSVGTNGSMNLLAGCVQPAIHLNLSAAMTSITTEIDNPQNVSTTYNGNEQTVESVVAADSAAYPWYNPEWYEHTGNYINLTYQDSQGITNVQNAGEYWVKAEITDAWKVAVDAEVDAEKTKWGWNDTQKAEAKKNRSPKFAGNPVNEDGRVESDIVRWFKFTIKPKELDIPISPGNTPKYDGGDISFSIGAYTADWNGNVEIVKPDGVKYENGALKVKNAGTYSVKAKITSNNFCWAGTSDSATPDRGEQPISVTVLPKDLIINFESSVDGKFNIAVGESVTFTAVPSAADVVAGDVVTPTITYYKGSDTTNVITGNGAALDASELPVGTYTLGAKLENKDGTANSNYKITTVTPQTVKVGSKTITIENVTWRYEQDGEHTPISGNSVELTYNGKEFTFTVKETTEELRAKGVKIDSYSGNVQTNATNGAVTVKVKLVPYDESFEFSDNKTEVEFSLTVTINRAKIDFNKLVWSASPTNKLEYTGNTQTVTIVSGIPSFYDVTYRDNSYLSVGTYTTKILSITVKDDAESKKMAENYSVKQSDYASYTYTWEIVRKKIEAKWTNVAHTTTDGKTVYIPEITGADAGVLKYEYTTDPDGETKELSDILSSYSETKISYYKVTVTIDSAYAASYELVDSDYVVQPSASQNFAVGNNKKSVTVSLQETKVYFNNQPQAVKLNYTGEGIILGDFAVEYKLVNADGSEGEATNTAPTAVGKYKVTITLQGEKANTHIIVGESVFEYVIAHKDRFILTAEAAASHPYKFLYEDFHEYEQDIKEYLYNAENAESVVYIAHLAFEDTLADLLRQFANAEDITAWGADGTVIEDLTTVLATGMMLRMMDGDTVLNQLTISVMGDIDGDGDIGTADKARLNSYTLGNLELKGAYLLACDLDGDGEVGTADKARLNAYTLGNLDIYVGLILRATAQATSEAVSACDEPAVAELTFIEESAPVAVTSAATEATLLMTSAQTSATSEYTIAAVEYPISVDTEVANDKTNSEASDHNESHTKCANTSISLIEQKVIAVKNSIQSEYHLPKKTCRNMDIN